MKVIPSLYLTLFLSCSTWHPAETLLEVELCAEGDSQMIVQCECLLKVAEDRHTYEEWRAYKGRFVARMKAEGIIARCEHGLVGEED